MTAVIAGPQRARVRFAIPPGTEAAEPPERRGLARDGVRLLVATADGIVHRDFRDLPALLTPGDVVVVNTSATVPAAIDGRDAWGASTLVHVSSWLDDATWIVEVRRRDNSGPELGHRPGDVLELPGALTLTLQQPHPDAGASRSRLWTAAASAPTEPVAYLAEHGRPIVYSHLRAGTTLAEHQSVYGDEPGSAEMPSAGRPFTPGLLIRLMAAGITVVPLTLHAGVSSPEAHELPAPERYAVPEATVRAVMAARACGQGVVAVGTTVVRALETVARQTSAHGGSGWTDLVLDSTTPPRLVNGLVTGLHLPESSHLMLLEAVAGPALVEAAYAAAIEQRYLWHEFGDSMLLLP